MSLRLKFLTICNLSALLLFVFNCFSQQSKTPSGLTFTVVIDAGHGGHDNGCKAHSKVEKEVALELALLTGQLIKDDYPDFNVVYTRQTDVFIPLNDRIKIANDLDADLFVSIHCNSVSKKSTASGTETFVMGLHSSQENLEVAKRENASILLESDYKNNYEGFDPYTIEGHILLSAIQNNHLHKSIEIASTVQENLTVSTPLQNRGVKQAGFLLLRKATMPSILIESAFLSNKSDATYISSQNGLINVSSAIAKGIASYGNKVLQNKMVINTRGVKDTPNTTQMQKIAKIEKKAEKPEMEVVKSMTVINPKEEPNEPKIVYSIQIASMTKPFNPKNFPSYSDLDNIVERKEEDLYKYTAGEYHQLEEALNAQKEIRSKGIKGAFVVAYQGNKRIKV